LKRHLILLILEINQKEHQEEPSLNNNLLIKRRERNNIIEIIINISSNSIIYMSNIQIYYICSDNVKTNLSKSGIDLNISIELGDRSLDKIYDEIKNDPYFYGGQETMSYNHFLSLIMNDISLYASLDGRVVGILNFMFLEKDGERIINFNGICCPIKCAGKGVGKKLIKTLIHIAKDNNTKYIYLVCKGDIMQYYHNKFGFEITSTKISYDSDEDEDELGLYYDEGPYYFMRLDLSKVIFINKKEILEEKDVKEEKEK
jgi:N-acetylglutamate synthase-like GNAT family acetyltransferase